MDFFKSVFSPDPEPSETDHPVHSPDPDVEQHSPHAPIQDTDSPAAEAGGGSPGAGTLGSWGFGGFIKTIASKSESVIQTYKRDLVEFSTGLKKETVAIREVAAKAVLDLPGSLEAGASAAQESLESVGQAIDELGGTVWRGTAEIILQGKEALLAADSDADMSDSSLQQNPGSSRRYTRFEAQVLAIQSDQNTFLEQPEDAEDFKLWNESFVLDADKEEEIEELYAENGALQGLLSNLVPNDVDYDTFWTRYFYKIHKLKQAEDARVELVRRAISAEEEEELSWDVDDDEDGEEEEERKTKEAASNVENDSSKEDDIKPSESGGEIVQTQTNEPVEVQEEHEDEKPIEKAIIEVVEKTEPPIPAEGAETEPKGESFKSDLEVPDSYLDDKTVPDGNAEPVESCKDSDISVISSQPSVPEEDDLGWDEIEDLGDHDEKKAGVSGGNTSKVDLRKRLSVAEDDEDLSWDIEDD